MKQKYRSHQFIYFAGETPTLAERLAPLEGKKEKGVKDELGVRSLVDATNRLFDASRDRTKDLPKNFQNQLHDNIIQYFLTSAERYDTNGERGLNKAEFEKYKTDMLKKVTEVIAQYAPSKEMIEARKKQKEGAAEAGEAAEKSARIEIKDTNFNEANLGNPQGIQQELAKFNAQSGEVRKETATLGASIGDFQKAFQRFEAGKKEWGVFLRAGADILLNSDPETDRLRTQLLNLKSNLDEKIHQLQAKKQALAEYGKKLNESGDTFRRQKIDERDKKLQAIDTQGTQAEQAQKKNETQYRALEAQQQKLYGQRDAMADYYDGLAQELVGVSKSREEVRVKADQMKTFGGNLEKALFSIDGALANNPPSPQKEELEAKKKELAGHKGSLDAAVSKTGDAEGQLMSTEQGLQEKRGEARSTRVKLDEYLAKTVSPSLEALSGSIQAIEIAKLKNGTQREQIEAGYAEILQTVDTVDVAVAHSVLENNLAHEQALAGLEAERRSLDAISIDQPNLWNGTGGLIFGKIGEGWSLLTKDVICAGLDYGSGWLKKVTRDIPVLNVFTQVTANILIDLPSGVIEGTGELINGITTMIAHPIDTAAGMGALIGRNPQTGEWSPSNAGNAWREMGKAMIAYENFEKGEVGKGLGKVALNVFLTATGAGAATKGAQGASLAYSVARASGAGVTRASLRAAGTGARLFAAEFSSGLVKIPGETISTAGKILKTPAHLVERVRTGAAARYGKEIAGMTDELGKASAQMDAVVIGGKKAAEIPGLKNKSVDELSKLSGKELAEMGIRDTRSIEEFMQYRTLAKKSEGMQASIRSLGRQKELAEMAPGLEKIHELNGKKLDRFVEKFNRKNPEGLKDKMFKVAERFGDDVVAFDETGKLKKYTINESTARDVLGELKKIDEQLKGSVSTFELRRECLHKNPKINTAEAYTYGELPKDKVAMKQYLHDPANWVPERRALHEAILEASYKEALQMSERMGQHPPVLFLMRGNSGVGKTTVLRGGTHPRIQHFNILDAHGQPHGSINTDTFKAALRKTEKVAGEHTVTHPQTHPEGGILAEKQIARLFEERKSIVVDKRLGTVDDVDELVVAAKEKGYRVVMIDVDASLQTSLDRVHGNPEKGIIGRDPRGDDPIVPTTEIYKGFDQVRSARRVIESRVDEYYLFDNDVPGRRPELVSQTIDGKHEVFHAEIHEAIAPLTRDYYVDSAMGNLRATSRTSAGVVDTSATTVKASSMAEGLSPSVAAKKANENFYRVIERAFAERSRPFSSPDELRVFVEQIAADVNGGILKEGVLLRRADSVKFPYTRVADLPRATEEFYAEFLKRLNDPATDPIEFAAWVEWKIDLTHHFFEDGCGKTSKAISTFVLAKYGKELPRYRGRGEYYAAAKPQSFDHWFAYYRTLFR